MAQVIGDLGSSGWPARPCGVWGNSRDHRGVIGSSRDKSGVRGESHDTIGTYGYGRIGGVVGHSFGAESPGDPPQIYAGVYALGTDFGLYGEGRVGIYARTSSPDGWAAALFNGDVIVEGDFVVTSGAKSAAVPDSEGTLRQLYSVESPEAWFEDFGRAALVEGQSRVELDQGFADVVRTDDYHVFVTPEGEANGLYVAERTPNDFLVREQGGGTSTLPFSFRIVARRKDIRADRLARVEWPSAPSPEGRRPSELDPPEEWREPASGR